MQLCTPTKPKGFKVAALAVVLDPFFPRFYISMFTAMHGFITEVKKKNKITECPAQLSALRVILPGPHAREDSRIQ